MSPQQGEFFFADDTPPVDAAPPDQKQRRTALTEFQRNVVVTAGAGTGKTSLLVGRLVSAMVRQHFEPGAVLAVTFTEKAAAEMEHRLVRMLEAVDPWLRGEDTVDASDAATLGLLQIGPENRSRVRELLDRRDEWQISTFHGFCLRFLQQHARQLNLPPELRPTESLGSDERFEAAFLEFLEKQASDEPAALERFELSDLANLTRKLLELPEESLDRVRAQSTWPALEEQRAELQSLLEEYSHGRAKWLDMVHCLLAGYEALANQRPLPEFPDRVPKPGKREIGDIQDEVEKQTKKHRDFLVAAGKASDDQAMIAVDFLRPFLRDFREQMAQHGDVSFQDLMLLTRQALMKHESVRQRMNQDLAAILVDEFQDTDPLQYDIVFLLGAKPTDGSVQEPMNLTLRPSLFIVGDAKQSIYRFRNADIAAFGHAVEILERQGALRLDLTANFRSDAPILDLVNRVCAESLRANPPYQFGFQPVLPMASCAEPAPARIVRIDSSQRLNASERREREGRILVQQIQSLRTEGVGFAQMAILLRARTDLAWLMRPLRQAGIPHALEGSRRFYQRQEVQLATTLLTAVARPQDPVGVLGVLRSALSAATDRDLASFLLPTNKRPNPSLDYLRPISQSGAVATTLGWLRDLHTETRNRPVGEAITHILGSDELLLAACSGFEAAQSLGNLDRMLTRLLEDPAASLAETVRQLENDIALDTDDEESALYDPDQEAVRIMTVHTAKGLEFDTVLLPDMARQEQGEQRGETTRAERVFDKGGMELVTIRIGKTQNLYHVTAATLSRQHSRAETRRLFYVAATRARRRLVLLCGEPDAVTEGTLWQHDLVQTQLGPDVEELTNEGLQAVAPFIEQELRPGAVHPALRHHRKLVAQASAQTQAAEVIPSAALEKHDAAWLRDARGRGAGLRLGIAMHSYMALVDFAAETVNDHLLQQVAKDNDVTQPQELAVMAEEFHDSELRVTLCSAAKLQREVPLSYLRDGQIVNGVIDLLFEDDTGRVHILDWKTDRVDGQSPEQLSDKHRAQMQSYANGVQAALRLPNTPARLLHFLRNGTTVSL